MHPAKILFLLLVLLTPLHANQASDEILATFQTLVENGKDVDDLCLELGDQEQETLDALVAAFERAWPRVRDGYLSAFSATAKKGLGTNQSESRSRIRELREEFMKVYAMGEGPMKPLLKSKSMPALQELRKLHEPSTEELVAASGEDLRNLRDKAQKFGKFRDEVLEAAMSTIPRDSLKSLSEGENKLTPLASKLSSSDLRNLEKNFKIAEQKDVPEVEARGIDQCNRWRLYLGLNMLELDPKLCAASRDHSKDMAEKNFFAHESPVPGKKTPWQRAENFRTKASSENIFMGSSNPEAANKGWFFSPGHHKNMFKSGPSRIGLGNHAGHWTQMFGS